MQDRKRDRWMLNFKPVFSLSSFTFIKRLFSFSLLSAIRVVSSAFLRLLIYFPTIVIPAWDSSNKAFHMVYSAYKLNKQGDNTVSMRSFANLELVCVPSHVLNCCYMYVCIYVYYCSVAKSFFTLLWSHGLGVRLLCL